MTWKRVSALYRKRWRKQKIKKQNSRPPKRICSPSKRLIFKGELLVSRRVSASKGLGFWLRSPLPSHEKHICRFYLVGRDIQRYSLAMMSQCFINVIKPFPSWPEKKIISLLLTHRQPNFCGCFSRKCAQGQDYFKQSSTRLHFIADRVIMFTQDAWQVCLFLGKEGRMSKVENTMKQMDMFSI